MAAQALRLAPGLAHGVTVYAYPDNFVTKRIIQHIIKMAKNAHHRPPAGGTTDPYRRTLYIMY